MVSLYKLDFRHRILKVKSLIKEQEIKMNNTF
jgi:hypothetical protein